MWLTGERRSPTLTYELVSEEPLTLTDDVAFTTEAGEEKPFELPLSLQVALKIPVLRDVPARLRAYGLLPERARWRPPGWAPARRSLGQPLWSEPPRSGR